jgi:hypothetical protein
MPENEEVAVKAARDSTRREPRPIARVVVMPASGDRGCPRVEQWGRAVATAELTEASLRGAVTMLSPGTQLVGRL